MSGAIRKKLQRKFKIWGYTLKVEALNEALAFLTHFPEHVHDDALDLLLDELQQQTCNSYSLSLSHRI